MTGRKLPTGTVTFVFTDIEGSTKLTQELGEEAWTDVLEAHGRVFRSVTATHGGVEVNTEGDAFFLAFDRPTGAVQAAAEVQMRLADELPMIRVRIGIHTGEARLGADDYVGMAVVKAARVSASAHGGQIILTEATRLALADLPSEISLQSLGNHRLKDLGDPVGLYQLRHPKLDSDFPPLRTLDRVEHNIPIQLSSFIGRDQDLAAASELLGGHRLLTVTGPGGTGKTRFAYQLAADRIEAFPDGVWVLELAPVSDAEGIARAALSALGLKEQADRPPLEIFVDWASSRTALFVFDNCEHVVDAAALTITELLRKSPGATVMATSREALRVGGETVFMLASLSTSDPDDDPAGSQSVKLFVERATEANSRLVLEDDHIAAIVDICRRLEGMPLAIELAAAWVRSLTPAQIAERLGDRFQLLDKGVRGSEARQASLRGAIAWSYELLSPAEQCLLARLSIFEGGWTLEASEAVCGGPPLEADDVLSLLDALVDKSLVAQTTADGQARFRMLDTIRAFAAGERAAGGGDDLAARHTEFFAALAAAASSQPGGSGHQAKFFESLDTEAANLELVLDRLSAEGEAEAAARLANDLTEWWRVRGHWRAGYARLRPLLDADGLKPSTAARLQLAAGTLASLLAAPESEELLKRAERCAADLEDDLLRAEALDLWGRVAFMREDFDLAGERHAEALAIGRKLGDIRSAVRSLYLIADLDYAVGRFDSALEGFEEALKFYEDIGDRRGEAETVLALMTMRHADLGDVDGAAALGRRGLGLARELVSPELEATALQRLARLEASQNNLEAAAALGEAAQVIYARIGDRVMQVVTMSELAQVVRRQGRPADARRLLEEGLAFADQANLARYRESAILDLAALDLQEGRHTEALDRAERLLAEASVPSFRFFASAYAGRAALALGQLDLAKQFYETALALVQELGHPQGEMEISGWPGRLVSDCGATGCSRDWYDQALKAACRLGCARTTARPRS